MSLHRRSVILAAGLLACGMAQASDKEEARAVVEKARIAFGEVVETQESTALNLINSQMAVDGLMANAVKLGGDASVAVGPVGAGQGANVTADFASYSKAKGAFMGMSVEGSVLDVRATLNHAYYGKDVTAIDIVIKRSMSNARAAGLRKAVVAVSK